MLDIVFKSFWDLFCDVFFFKPDIVIINREICPKFQTKIHYLLEKKLLSNAYVIWDFDDAILVSGEISHREWRLLEEKADKIVVLSEYHKENISKPYTDKVDFLPTTDGDYIKMKFDNENIRQKSYPHEIRLLWLATATNVPYLEKCLTYIEKAAQILKENYFKQLVLICVCNKEIVVKTNYLHIINVKWERKKALEIMQSSHIGIMPLEDDKFSRGKGGFKLIQYMSAAMPVIASAVGLNQQIVKSDFGFLVTEKNEWCEAIVQLATNYEIWNKCSKNAKIEWDCHYSYQMVYDYWKKIIQ